MNAPFSSSFRPDALRSVGRVALLGLVFVLTAGGLVAKETPGKAAGAASPPTTNAAPAIPQSVFNTDPQFGRDPFFPRSARRSAQAATETETAPTSRFPQGVRLSGISVSATRRLAIINRATFAAGESGEIKIENRRVPIRVEAVKDNSVVVTINGITEEIFLREGL